MRAMQAVLVWVTKLDRKGLSLCQDFPPHYEMILSRSQSLPNTAVLQVSYSPQFSAGHHITELQVQVVIGTSIPSPQAKKTPPKFNLSPSKIMSFHKPDKEIGEGPVIFSPSTCTLSPFLESSRH